MATISTGLWGDSNAFNLKEIDSSKVRSELLDFFVDGEEIISAFETIRDQVVFSNKRILVVNVQGLTGKKRAYISYPYSKIQYFGVETAGVLDIDSELFLAFNDGKSLSFDFKTSVDIVSISKVISSYVL